MSDDATPSPTATAQPSFDTARLDAVLESITGSALPTPPPAPEPAQDSPTEPPAEAQVEATPTHEAAPADEPVETLAARFKRLAQREKEQAEHRRSM